MNIVFVASEIYPFSKVGGLSDVLGALPNALAGLGLNVKVITPGYAVINRDKFNIRSTSWKFNVNIGVKREECRVSRCSVDNGGLLEIFFIENNNLISNRGVYYDKSGAPYEDNAIRFLLFQKAVLKLISMWKWKPDVIHCHDNHTALIPLYLKTGYAKDSDYSDINTVLTMHNLAYQGIMPMETKDLLQLPQEFFNPMGDLEFYGSINPLKAGILHADVLTTVSMTHAKEILLDPAFDFGLQQVIFSSGKTVHGILNGADYKLWNPESDKLIYDNYSASDISGKNKNKRMLIKDIGWSSISINRPLLGMVSRLVDQKGIDLVIDSIDRIVEMGTNIAVLGSGDERYENGFLEASRQFPEHIFYEKGYNNILAHRLFAACDMFIIPSRFEPCGMTQMYSLKYGTIPVVRNTGGLSDTVTGWDGVNGTGFLFDDYSVEAFLGTLKRAIETFHRSSEWYHIIGNAMQADFSWKKSAEKYLQLYKKIH